ncbi:MAG: hypothetical protein JJU11_08385 [Candidatus Sumerlaeia bacterium]|nr:hypothetical protein [Candidatus Sumerlaeia bacterium]
MSLLALPAFAAAEVVYRFDNSQAVSEWRIGGLDSSLPPPRIENGRLVVECGPETYIARPVSIRAEDYNRIELRVNATTDLGHLFSMGMVSWARQGETDIQPERQVEVEIPGDTMAISTFQMDQSLRWEGDISHVRFDFHQKVQKHGGRLEIESVRFYRDEDLDTRLHWQFGRDRALDGWQVGEILFDGWQFQPLPYRFEDGAMVFTSENGFPAIQRDVRFEAEEIDRVSVRLRYEGERQFRYERGTWSKFFWGWGDSSSPTRLLRQPLLDTSGVNEFHHHTMTHHYWRGTIAEVQFVLVSQPGTVWLEEVQFHRLEDLGTEGDQRALVSWMDIQAVNEAIRSSETYKPLLVFVDNPGVAICRQVEQQLGADPFFRQEVENFHSVRLQYDDPVVTGWLRNIYRVPTMLVFSYDTSARRWVEKDRLVGPTVAEEGSLMLQRNRR